MPAISSIQAARLVAISRDAKSQSEEAIRLSLRLLRQPTYPDDLAAPSFARKAGVTSRPSR